MKNLKYILLFFLLYTNLLFCQQPVFGPEIPVTINGLNFDAMEPAISTDGNAMFFNSLNDGITTSLFYAAKINDSTFNYIGPVPVVNQTVTPRLDAVASLDSANNFYWVSTRNYPANYKNLQRIRFLTAGYTNLGQVHGDFYIQSPGWLIMDAAINYDGDQLIYCNAWFNGCANSTPCRTAMGIATKINDSTFNKTLNTAQIMSAINDTINYIVYAPHLTKDGLELYYSRLLKNGTQTEILVSTRSNTLSPFGPGQVLITAPSVLPEAPTLTTDKSKMYYHKKIGDRFYLFLRKRDLTVDVNENITIANVSIYPNPVTTCFYINSNTNTKLRVYNSIGTCIINTNSKMADLSDASPGLYSAVVETEGKIIIFKLVKQ